MLLAAAIHQLLAPVVGHAGDVTTYVVHVVVVKERRQRTVHTALSLLRVLVLGIVLHAEGVEHAATAVAEGNLEDRLTTGLDDVLAEVGEVLLEAAQRVATLVDDAQALVLGNLIHVGLRQFGVVAQAYTISTLAVATGIEGDAGTQTLDEGLAHALHALRYSRAVGPCAVAFSL